MAPKFDAERVRRSWLWLIKRSLNRVTLRAARAGVGPFALVRHVGRKSGKRYETPLLLARVDEGYVAELTYGPRVDWYRNVTAAGHCEIVVGGRDVRVGSIEPYDTEAGYRAFGPPASTFLRATHRREFRLLRTAVAPSA